MLQKGSAFGGVVQKEILPAVFIGLSEQIGAFLRLKFSEEREEASIPGEKAGLGRCRRFPGGIHILCECLGDDALFLRQVVIFAVILQVVSERAGGQGDGEPECLPLENAVDALQPQTDRSGKQHAEPAPDQQFAAAVLKIGNADLIRYLAVGENRNQTHHAQNIFKIVQLQEIEAPGILFFDIFLIDGDEAASVEGILPVDAKKLLDGLLTAGDQCQRLFQALTFPIDVRVLQIGKGFWPYGNSDLCAMECS